MIVSYELLFSAIQLYDRELRVAISRRVCERNFGNKRVIDQASNSTQSRGDINVLS